MSVIIRLQNLAWSANALDIRQFFRGLSIPEGGVHIVGGELGDAFIAFSTDEDARQAMMNDGGKIKEMKIKLLLSSRTEMQKVIETARQQTLSLQNFMRTVPVQVAAPPVAPSKPESPVDAAKKERDNDSESSKDRKDRRYRSLSRDRSRSRDRDRDRDRERRDRDRGRDRRRRERSRSRDRERDRRDRRRRRDRSRSRDRTRSRERDAKRASGERRKEANEEEASDVVCVGQFPKDKLSPSTKKPAVENGIWEVPPQSQMQAAMLAPGILGAGVAALPQDPEQRSLQFGAPVMGQQPMLQPNQFALNGLNGVGGLMPPHVPGIGHAMGMNALPQNVGSATLPGMTGSTTSLTRPRELWNGSEQGRLDQMRFPSARTSPFGASDTAMYNMNNSGNTTAPYRPPLRPSNPFLSKMQELDTRRNPHAFQTTMGLDQFGAFANGPERTATGRSATNKTTRFSSDVKPPSGGHCVEVRNMPLNASYGDVRHAFQGIYIRKDGLKLINDTHGNRVGIAYIKFGLMEGKELALTTPRFVRGSEVEVLPLDETIFDKAVDSYVPEKESDRLEENESDIRLSTCILLTELPSFTKEMDIAKLFHDWKINDLFITSTKDSSNALHLMAFVQFARLEDAKASLSIPLKIGMKQVTATAITEEKFAQAKRDREQESLGESANLDCIIMRGLPFQTVDRDILDFFSDIGIVPHRIHVMLNQNGKPAGECFCEFDSPEEAVRATAKNGLPLGKNVPTIELVSRNKMMDTLGMVDTQLMENQPHYPPIQESRSRFPAPMSNHPPRIGGLGFGPRGPPGMLGMPPRHMLGRHGPPGPLEYVEGFGKPGCVLSLENVPFKADIEEIIEFFGDFDVKRENVIRRYNDKGMPTGDARVAFSSPGEAQRALRDLRHCKMRDRTIFMKIA